MKKITWFKHGYQPTSQFTKWMKFHLEKIFLPTSQRMREGLDTCGARIQGSTIDEYLERDDLSEIRPKFNEFLENIRKSNTVEKGSSSYSHAILPLLSDELKRTLIKLDYNTIKENIGEPIFCFPPEGAVDQKTIEIISEFNINPVIPDNAVGMDKFTGIVDFQGTKCFVFNRFLKDSLMNDYLKKYLPKCRKNSMKEGKSFHKVIRNNEIIATDWENKSMRKYLKEGLLQGPKEAAEMGFVKFVKPSEMLKSKSLKVSEIIPSSWEPKSYEKNPYPLWDPREGHYRVLTKAQKTRISAWKKMISIYDNLFHNLLDYYGSEKNLLDNEENMIKKTSGALVSCVPWHITVKSRWGGDIKFAKYLFSENCIPKTIMLNERLNELGKDINERGNLKSLKNVFCSDLRTKPNI